MVLTFSHLILFLMGGAFFAIPVGFIVRNNTVKAISIEDAVEDRTDAIVAKLEGSVTGLVAKLEAKAGTIKNDVTSDIANAVAGEVKKVEAAL